MSTLLLIFCLEFPKVFAIAVTFGCGRAMAQHIEKVQEEVAYITYRWVPEVHLFFCAPFLKNVHFEE